MFFSGYFLSFLVIDIFCTKLYDKKLLQEENINKCVCKDTEKMPLCEVISYIEEKLQTKNLKYTKEIEQLQDNIYIHFHYNSKNITEIYAVISKLLCFFYEYVQNTVNYTKLSCNICDITDNQTSTILKLKKYYNELKLLNIKYYDSTNSVKTQQKDSLTTFVKTSDSSTLQRRNLYNRKNENENVTLYYYSENDINARIFDIFKKSTKNTKTDKILLFVLPFDKNNDQNTAANCFYNHIYKAISSIECEIRFDLSYICKNTSQLLSKSCSIINNTLRCKAKWQKNIIQSFYKLENCVCNEKEKITSYNSRYEILLHWQSFEDYFTINKHYLDKKITINIFTLACQIKQPNFYYVFDFKNVSLSMIKIIFVDCIVDEKDQDNIVYKRLYYYQIDQSYELRIIDLHYCFSYTYSNENLLHKDDLAAVYILLSKIIGHLGSNKTENEINYYFSFLNCYKYRIAFDPIYKIERTLSTKYLLQKTQILLKQFQQCDYNFFYLQYDEYSINTLYNNVNTLKYDSISITPEKWCKISEPKLLHIHFLTKTPVILKVTKKENVMVYTYILKFYFCNDNNTKNELQNKKMHSLKPFCNASNNIEYNTMLDYILNLSTDIKKLLIINKNLRERYLRHICSCILICIKSNNEKSVFNKFSIKSLFQNNESRKENVAIDFSHHKNVDYKNKAQYVKKKNKYKHLYTEKGIEIIHTWNTCDYNTLKQKCMFLDEFYDNFLIKFRFNNKMKKKYNDLKANFDKILDMLCFYYDLKKDDQNTVKIKVYASDYYCQEQYTNDMICALNDVFSNE